MSSPQTEIHETVGLEGARADFVASIGRRVEGLRSALDPLADASDSTLRRENLLRRVRTFGEAARVLGFDEVVGALQEAEQALDACQGQPSSACRERYQEVARVLGSLPALAWGGPVAIPKRASRQGQRPGDLVPTSVLVCSAGAVGAALRGDAAIEVIECEDPADAPARLQALGPDAVVVDVDEAGMLELIERLASAGTLGAVPLLVVGGQDKRIAAPTLAALGAARVLPKPVGPEALRQAIAELTTGTYAPSSEREPIGDATVEELGERIATEIKRGLVQAVGRGGGSVRVPYGEGTDVLAAVWGAVARIRELATLHSGGSVRFDAAGPEGAIPLAPWTGGEQHAGRRAPALPRGVSDAPLHGRRAVVVDDDPAVVWFMAGLLKAAGVEVLEAHDGRRALELATVSWPDLVISDINMPKLDGFSLCREIKRDVAIRDVPVLLLSWKEDLLQRARELGADADAYLRKEASESIVLERVREVLRPRARVEQRLAEGGDVRGRLDRLTPRLIIQLAGDATRNARVSIRDAAYLYEVEIRGGRPKSATRTDLAGRVERGEKVLGALLGVAAGRFVISSSSGPCQEDFNGTLQEVIAPAVRAARTAQRALAAEVLPHVRLVGIDQAAIAGYLPAMPTPARALVERLLGGAAPRDLLTSGEVGPWLLEAVLADLACHGAIRAVEGAPGLDLLQRARSGPIPREALIPEAEAPTPSPQFTFSLSPSPDSSVDEPVVGRFVADAPVLSGLHQRQTKREPPERELASFRRDPGRERAPQSSPAQAEVEVSEPNTVARALRTSLSASVPVAVAEQDPSNRSPAGGVLPARRINFPTNIPEPQLDDVSAREAAPRATKTPAMAVPQIPGAAPTSDAASSSGAPPVDIRTVLEGHTLPDVACAPENEALPRAADPPGALAAETAAEPSATAAPAVMPQVTVVPTDTAEPSIAGASATPPTKRIVFPTAEPSPPPAPPSSAEAPAEAAPASRAISGLLGMGRIAGVTALAAVASFGVVRYWVTPASRPPAAIASASQAQAPVVPLAASAPVAPAPVASEPAPGDTADQPHVEELSLPPGFALADGKGLLEVATEGREAIYVGDAFMGRGPIRRIPVEEGTHQVKIRSEGDSVTFSVKVTQGKRARLSLLPEQ